MAKGIKIAGICACVLSIGANALAKEMPYFDSTINYWGKPKQDATKEIPKQQATKTADKREANAETAKPETFKWETFLNPKNKEFFREGDYTPPEPFMELVRNPTDENIRMWFTYMERKNELSSRLAKRMEEFSKNNAASLPREAKVAIQKTAASIPLADDEFERFRFRMYFDSQCPHCHQMFETLNDLQDRGYFVEARQVDRGSLAGIHSNVAIVQADSAEVHKYHITSVPLLLIGDLKNKKVFRQSGFMTPDEVLASIHRN